MRAFLLLFLCLFSAALGAQSRKWNPVDTVRYYTNTRNGGFRIGLDGYHSFLSGMAANVVGFRYGLTYGKLGVYSGYYSSGVIKSNTTDTQTITLNYISSTLEYYVHQSWRFEVAVPIKIGYGIGTTLNKSAQQTVRVGTEKIVPLELGVGASVRFLRYLGFAAGLGLRVDVLGASHFSTPYYYGNFTFFTGTLYKDVKKLLKK